MKIKLSNQIVNVEDYNSSSIIRTMHHIESIEMNTNTNLDKVSLILYDPNDEKVYFGIGGLNNNERFIYNGTLKICQHGDKYKISISSNDITHIFNETIPDSDYYICIKQKSIQTSNVYIVCDEFYESNKFKNSHVIIKYDHENNYFKIIKNEKGFISCKKK